MTFVALAIGAISFATSLVRWARVAQREHYLPGGCTASAARWVRARWENVVLLVLSVGALVGALVSGALTDRIGVRATLVVAQLGSGFGRLALVLVSPGGLVLPTLLAAEFLVGVTMPLFNINLMSLRQAVASDDLQGRVNATVGMLLWATAPIGGLLGAVLGDVFGVRAVLALVAVLTCVIAAVLLLPSREDLEVHEIGRAHV